VFAKFFCILSSKSVAADMNDAASVANDASNEVYFRAFSNQGVFCSYLKFTELLVFAEPTNELKTSIREIKKLLF
jgi:hypothetical protein